ncbi:hypothetical protein LLT6_15580 [Lactococcus cremoris subsp. cremoris TIFN6]|uniref:Uncharacterized protein n=1 Tax=Lactococcus cremoris subsp. cremoris TIFN6 TaxID=1234876 RepID=T0TCQ7_LACLC|nr:hypothetical protein LLT6_15580 [Lactococcus cremoris subsp. cremoris TIFN6]
MPNISNGVIKNTEIRARKNDIIGVYFLNKKTAETTLGGFTFVKKVIKIKSRTS